LVIVERPSTAPGRPGRALVRWGRQPLCKGGCDQRRERPGRSGLAPAQSAARRFRAPGSGVRRLRHAFDRRGYEHALAMATHLGYGCVSAEQLWHWAGIQSLIRPVGPAPPDMPTCTPPQRSAGPAAVVLPPGQYEATGLHGLAAVRTGRGVVAHAAHPKGATAASRSNVVGRSTLGLCASHPR
jgi:hypothetical protein